jgi:hypothetical protein
MRVLENNYGWNPIETAPLDKDVTLEVTDGRGARYRLPNPCRRTASGWSGRIVARTGLRMMPTFPRSPLTFRKASFPRYG